MNGKSTTVVALALLLTGFAAVASAADYADTGRDPDDPGGIEIDVHSTTRVVWTTLDGRRWLRIVIRPSYPPLLASVALDAVGDAGSDHRLELSVGEGWCVGHGSEGRFEAVLRVTDDAARCRVLLSDIGPTKRIRWWVWADSDTECCVGDRAPDAGWYG